MKRSFKFLGLYNTVLVEMEVECSFEVQNWTDVISKSFTETMTAYLFTISGILCSGHILSVLDCNTVKRISI